MARSAVTMLGIASLAVMVWGASDANAAQGAEIAGVWLNPKANTRVRIGPCGAALCGAIVWLKSPNDPQTGAPLTDRNNPDPANRNRPLVGIPMIIGLKPGRPGEWTGQVYLFNSGKSYDAGFSMDGPNGLKIEGCKLARLLCCSQTWTRVN